MTKRLAIALGALLACVSAAGVAAVALSLDAHAEALTERASEAAALVQARYEAERAAMQRQLQRTCSNDLALERLGLSLGGQPAGAIDAPRLARELARLLGAPVWLVKTHEAAEAVVAASGAIASTLPTEAALRLASESARAFPGEVPLVIESCARALRSGGTLWVVRAEPLAQLQKRLAPRAGALALVAPTMRTRDREQAEARALHLAGVDGAPDAELWLVASEPASLAALVPLAPLLGLTLLLGALVVSYVALRPHAVDDTVLVEIEQAAERVARGDLTARIARRSGGRADQTFQTFDRMTAELAEMRLRLAEAERAAAWQDMARRIAHEIKNPLSPIQLAIETLRKAHAKRLGAFDEIFEESTRAILEEVRRMEHIVREFSEFARLPRARPGQLALAPLVADTVALYAPEDVSVRVIDHSGEAQARADREQLTQVLVNLLNNAVDAARTSPEPKVELRIEASESALFVHVDDSGPGIAADARERVFEPYFTTKDHGTGLGLAIVRRIVFDHEGSVSVGESPLGGARFTVRLSRGPQSASMP